MSDLENLSPANRALLSLVLTRRRSFEQLAETLQSDVFSVRSRARAAVLQLVPAPAALPREDRNAVVDYLLREASVSSYVRLRSQLRAEGEMREWAVALKQALEPLATNPLPEIPGTAGTDAEEPDSRPHRWRQFFGRTRNDAEEDDF